MCQLNTVCALAPAPDLGESGPLRVLASPLLRHRKKKGHGLRNPVALDLGVDRHGLASCPWHPSKRYSADAPGRPVRARLITPRSRTRGAPRFIVAEVYGAPLPRSSAGPPAARTGFCPAHERLHRLDVL